MHKNINKIINTVLVGSVLSSNLSVFALNNEVDISIVNEGSLSENQIQTKLDVIDTIVQKGPFLIDTSINTTLDNDYDINLDNETSYFKTIINKHLGITGSTIKASELVNIVGFDASPNSENSNIGSVGSTCEWVKYMPNLKVLGLSLSKAAIEDLDVSSLAVLTKLETLKIGTSFSGIYKKTLSNVNELGKIQSLTSVTLNDFSDLDVSFISSLPNLKNLDVIGAKFNDSNAALDCINKATNLKELHIKNIPNVSNINGLINLETLHLESPKGLSSFDSFKNLKTLEITRLYIASPKLDFKYLQNLKNLESLTVYSLNPSMENVLGCEYLNSLTSLKTIKFDGLEDITTTLKLNNLKNLEYLSLKNTDVSDVSNMLLLPKLNFLDLSSTKVSNIEKLANAEFSKSLETLYINGANTNIKNLDFLKSYTNLKKVSGLKSTVENIDGVFVVPTIEDVDFSENVNIKEINIKNTNLKTLKIINTSTLDSGKRGALQTINIENDNNTITRIDVVKNSLNNMDFVKKLKGLTSLNLSDNFIDSVAPINDIKDQLNKNLYLTENFVPQNETDVLSSYFASSPIMYTLATKPGFDNSLLNLSENKPFDFYGYCSLFKEKDLSFKDVLSIKYSFEFEMDNHRMGYLNDKGQFIATKSGTITGTVRLKGSKTSRAALPVTFNSTLAQDLGSIKVDFIDSETKLPLKDSEYTVGIGLGSSVDIVASKIDGYTVLGNSSYKVNITKDNLDPTITFEYKKGNGSVDANKEVGTITVKYIDSATKNEISERLVESNKPLGEYTYTAKDIAGYRLVGEKVRKATLDSTNKNVSLVFEYEKELKELKGNVTIDYVDDKTGTKIDASDFVNDLSPGEYTFTSKDIKGYTLVSSKSKSLTIDDKNLTHKIEFRYSKNTTQDNNGTSNNSTNNNGTGNGTTNNTTGDKNESVNTDKDTNKDTADLPDTSGLSIVIKILSVLGIAGAIVLLRKKKKQ